MMYLQELSKQFSNVNEKMSGTNGIWTGHDWVDSTNGVEVNNGVPQGITDVMKRRIESTATYQG